MYEESLRISGLELRKDAAETQGSENPSKNRLPSGELSIKTKGDRLILRPTSPYRYKSVLEVKEDLESESFSGTKDFDSQFHQRSSTTIINDIAQSYTFVPAIKKTKGSINDEDLLSNSSIEQFQDEYKDSIMASTIDPKSFMTRPMVPERVSRNLTISSNSSEKHHRKFPSHGQKSLASSGNQHSLLESVTAFCNKCRRNTMTEVIENIYIGSFWEKLFCNICYSDASLREFTHICKYCETPVFQIKLRVE